MVINIKKYLKEYIIKFKTKINVDTDFYEDDEFYLIDLEV